MRKLLSIMRTRLLPAFLLLTAALFALSIMTWAETLDVDTPEELATVVNSVYSGDTIRLTANIDYSGGIVIENKTVTFDTNGYTLNVTNSAGHGLEVGSGGVVNLTGTGSFNITSSAVNMYGVYAHDGGQATVTSAKATNTGGDGAYAESEVGSRQTASRQRALI